MLESPSYTLKRVKTYSAVVHIQIIVAERRCFLFFHPFDTLPDRRFKWLELSWEIYLVREVQAVHPKTAGPSPSGLTGKAVCCLKVHSPA